MKRPLLLISGLLYGLFSFAQPTVLFEEQFDGGIPDSWEIGPGDPLGAVWQWTANGRADAALVNGVPTGAILWGNRMPINSPSVANGAAMYNSDVYDSGGINVGQGPYPNGSSGALTSPSVDCSGQDKVYLTFYQYVRAFLTNSSCLVSASNDGGQTWTDFPINRQFTDARSSTRDDVQLIDISEIAANQADVRVRFTWDGLYFFWLIDDVRLITPPKYALALENFFYTPASFAQPVTQVATDTFVFNIEMSNLGSDPIPNLVFKGSVLRASNNQVIYSDSLVLDEFPGLYRDSTLQIERLWAPDLNTGDYLLRFEVYSQNADIRAQDFTPLNDVRTAPFQISGRMFAKEDGPDTGVRPGTLSDYTIGNFYQMSPLAGNNFVIEELRFAAATNPGDPPLAGNTITFIVYKVKDEVASDWSNFEDIGDSSLDLAGFGTYTFTSDDDDLEILSVDVFDLDNNPIPLAPNGRYFAVVAYSEGANTIFHATDDDIDYFQISTIVKLGEEWFLGGFGPETSAVLRMVIQLSNTTDETPLEDSAMTLFPNPAADVLQVQLGLEAPTPAMLIIADMNGKVLDIREYAGVQWENLQFSLSSLPAGAYLIRLSTDAGTKTKQFIVAK